MVTTWNPEFPKAAVRIPISGGAGSVDASWNWSFTNPDGSLVTYHAGGTDPDRLLGVPLARAPYRRGSRTLRG